MTVNIFDDTDDPNSVDDWIKVEENLPNDGQEVDMDNGQIHFNGTYKNKMWRDSSGREIVNVKKWKTSSNS